MARWQEAETDSSEDAREGRREDAVEADSAREQARDSVREGGSRKGTGRMSVDSKDPWKRQYTHPDVEARVQGRTAVINLAERLQRYWREARHKFEVRMVDTGALAFRTAFDVVARQVRAEKPNADVDEIADRLDQVVLDLLSKYAADAGFPPGEPDPSELLRFEGGGRVSRAEARKRGLVDE